MFILKGKINQTLKEHPEITPYLIKRISEILSDPVLIIKSKNYDNAENNSRIIMFGGIKSLNRLPVMCIYDIIPAENKIYISDYQKIVSTYTKDIFLLEKGKAENYFKDTSVLFVSKSKKRVDALLRAVGF